MGRPKKALLLRETGGNVPVTMGWLIPMIVMVLKPIVNALTPIIRAEIVKAIQTWYPKAVATPNPWDDFLVVFLAKLLQIDVE
jgi:hypothetical protein